MNTFSPFDAFNARDLAPESVASSFVPFGKYEELLRSTHSLLIGPRGSGKTTLLKMLSLEALRLWEHPLADRYRQSIGYTGVFVPADITWGEMVDALVSDRSHVPPECKAALGEIAFGINVLLAAAETMSARCRPTAGPALYRSVGPIPDSETLVLSIAKAWRLEIDSVSFTALSQALRERLADLYSLAKEFSHSQDPSMERLFKLIPYANLDTFAALQVALETFDNSIGDPHGRWAVLLDEFEVVPVHIQRLVISKLRASSAKLIFKVALAPCGPQTQNIMNRWNQPSPLDDVTRIELWYRDKKEAIAFCRKLFESRAPQSSLGGLSGNSPESVLGQTLVTDGAESAEEDGSHSTISWADIWKPQFKELARRDVSFNCFVAEKGIDLDSLDSSTNSPHGDLVRKIAPVVAFRNAYRSVDGKRRGRKPYYLPYTGWEAIATISEGNPRWFIGMLVGLERELADNPQIPIPPHIQWKQVSKAMAAFQEKLKTVAIENNIGITTNRSVFELLKQIGESFEKSLVVDDFIQDPPMTFVVDKQIDGETENCLRIALNFGGLVCYEPPDHIAGYQSLRGKRFRLAYILSPVFKLPLRIGKENALTSLIKKRETSQITQGSLW